MNAEPPTARFQVEHQPRRPDYAKRYALKANRMHNTVLIVFIFCVTFAGCSKSDTPEPNLASTAVEQPGMSDGVSFPRLVIASLGANGFPEESAGNAVTPEILDQQFRTLNWADLASKPSIAVELAGDRSLRIALSSDATANQVDMIAIWREPGPKYGNTTSIIVRRSKPLKDDEQALFLLNLYANHDNKFESVVDWADQEPDAPDEND
jgi:hypothetical protein